VGGCHGGKRAPQEGEGKSSARGEEEGGRREKKKREGERGEKRYEKRETSADAQLGGREMKKHKK
jgi:hypothetical protein